MRKREVSRGWLYVVAVIAVVGALSWIQFAIRSLGNELEQTRADNAALAAQVRSLGGKPVVAPKPGAQGDQGPAGPQGPQGIQGPAGPPGVAGKQGPIGVTGQSPACLLEPSRCVGPKGATGAAGTPGEDGADGTNGADGVNGKDGAPGPAGPAGPAGADGQPGAAGKDGTNGTDGKDGRGIQTTTCQPDGTWLITYTDTTTQTVDGPCRIVVPQIRK